VLGYLVKDRFRIQYIFDWKNGEKVVWK